MPDFVGSTEIQVRDEGCQYGAGQEGTDPRGGSQPEAELAVHLGQVAQGFAHR